MAVLLAMVPRSPFQVVNPNISDNLDAFGGIVGWPFGASSFQSFNSLDVTSTLPVSTQARELLGTLAGSYEGDLYDRIHIRPSRLDLGNVVSVQTTSVVVWNAHRTAKTLQAINGLDEGLAVEGQPAPPLSFTPITERSWLLSVSPDGQPVLDTSISWQFTGGEEPAIRVTANRIIAWAWAPDWGDGVQETLEWSTDVLASESLAEQRRALRIAPRRELQAAIYANARERSALDLGLFGWGARIWAVPIWPEIQLLQHPVALGADRINCQTEHLDFAIGGLVMLRGEDAFTYEVAEVSGVDAYGVDLARATQRAWGAGTRLYPARAAQLIEEPSLKRLTDDAVSVDVRFLIMEACDWPAQFPAVTYRGRPVLDTPPEESEDLTSSFSRLRSTLDSGFGLPLFADIAQRAMPILQWRWLELGRAQRAQLRSLLYALRGRQVPVWVPTHAIDLVVTSTISELATTIDIEHIGYTRFGQNKPGRRDIRIQLWSGTVFYRRVTGCTELDATTERLVIDGSLGQLIEPQNIARVCWMTLCRQNTDRVEIDHQTDSEGLAAASLTFIGVRDDEF